MGVRKPGRRGVERLTELQCRTAKPPPRKLFDGRGLFLLLPLPDTGASKLWRLKYRFPKGGPEHLYSIGAYPEVSLAAAREERDRARAWLRDGKDPTVERRLTRARDALTQATTFSAIAEEWLGLQDYAEGTERVQRQRLDRDVIPYIGNLPIVEITPPMVLEALRRVERRGTLETAAKVRRLVSQVFRHAIVTGRAMTDPAEHLGAALKPAPTRNRATVELAEMPALFKAIACVTTEPTTRLALHWLVLTAARTGEMRFATWNEIDGKLWRIPAARMKMRRGHVVPLTRQALEVLKAAKPLRTSEDADALIFPGFTKHGALSENALLALLERAGYAGKQTSHGFRAAFSTWAHEEREADPDVIEACLAHGKEGVRGVYNRSAYLSQRLELLQAWADRCETWGMRLP